MTATQRFPGPPNSEHGTSVAIVGDWVAIGMPLHNETGAVTTYMRDSASGSYEESQILLSSPLLREFGSDIDFSTSGPADGPFLVVGAPSGNTTETNAGGVFFYTYNVDSSEWELDGREINGGSVFLSSNERFGSSVALSDNYRAVVGAPLYADNDAGRVYTFDLTPIEQRALTDWTVLSSTILEGSQANAFFGSAVDMTGEGTTMVVGEPGTSSFRIFEWIDDDWSETLGVTLATAADLGTEVKFLSSDFVAVGAPSASDGSGLVVVFQRQNETSDDAWSEVDLIEGELEERLGEFGTIGGEVGTNGPELVLATANGTIKRYDIFAGEWLERFSITDGATTVTSVDVASDSVYSVIVGFASEDSATIFEENEQERTRRPVDNSSSTPSPQDSSSAPDSSPTFAPVTSPTSPPVTSPPAEPRVEWRLTETGPITFTAQANTLHGSSVAWTGDIIVAGLPLFSNKLGAVQSYERSSSNRADFAVADLLGDSFGQSEEFGAALDMVVFEGGNVALLVGATETVEANNEYDVSFGSAYYYESDGSGGWTEIGDVLRSGETLEEAGGKFGQSVAIASGLRRAAVASPSSSVNTTTLDNGRVFTYDFDGTDWQPASAVLIGQPNSFMGTGLDMSADGLRLLVGAPGENSGDGKVYIFVWEFDSWTEFAVVDGLEGESFGTTVTIIKESADGALQFAVGCPTANENQGVVRVYGQSPTDGTIDQIGNDILGGTEGQIGTTVSGKGGRLAVGTSSGMVSGSFLVYDFDASSRDWVQVQSALPIETGSAVVSIAMADDGESVVVGQRNQALSVYDLVEVLR